MNKWQGLCSSSNTDMQRGVQVWCEGGQVWVGGGKVVGHVREDCGCACECKEDMQGACQGGQAT